MQLTVQQLQAAVIGCTPELAAKFLDAINQTLTKYEIGKTPLRVAYFLAQLGHESGSFKYVREIASGAAYEGRADLGNTHVGDGVRFRGRGLIQITGRANYKACGKALGVDLEAHPELLEFPLNAALSAGWYWASRNLNTVVDKDRGANTGLDQAVFIRVTKAINGGTNGLADRQARFVQARKALGIPAPYRVPPVKPAAPEKAL